MTALVVSAVAGIGEVAAGSDLGRIISEAAQLEDRDVVVVTSKVVSKAEGRVREMAREDAVAAETERVVARRGATRIVRTRTGLVMAAAGVDASNTEPGTVVLLPADPDGSARALRDRLLALTGRNVAVVLSDTFGRAWRQGQTDVAVGCAGLVVLDDHAGRFDDYGNELAVTAPALADEVAAAADLVTGKLRRTPAALVRGLSEWVLDPGQHGPGAAALVRPEAEDLFGYGAREAVLESVAPRSDGRGFGAVAGSPELVEALREVLESHAVLPPGTEPASVRATTPGPEVLVELGLDGPDMVRLETICRVVARAHGWTARADGRERIRFRPGLP